MDPLMMVIDEIVRLREDVTKLEQDISDCEVRIDFQPQDPRYIRLCTEKELVLKNLCDIRMELCQKGNLQHFYLVIFIELSNNFISSFFSY